MTVDEYNQEKLSEYRRQMKMRSQMRQMVYQDWQSQQYQMQVPQEDFIARNHLLELVGALSARVMELAERVEDLEYRLEEEK